MCSSGIVVPITPDEFAFPIQSRKHIPEAAPIQFLWGLSNKPLKNVHLTTKAAAPTAMQLARSETKNANNSKLPSTPTSNPVPARQAKNSA
jgi:hypothetical protein